MDMTAILVTLAKTQAKKLKAEWRVFLQSEEFEQQLAEKLDAKINIPFVKDEKEAKIFREFVDVVTDIIDGLVGDKNK